MAYQQLLTEKMRPQTLDDIILLDRIKNSIPTNEELSTHLLFSGQPGIGKTSLMKILTKNKDYLYINASEERGIETVRTKIIDYCSTVSQYGGKIKYVLLAEIDGAAQGFFQAYRAASEKFQHVRFLATCNYINKIPEPIQSRFLLLDFDPKTQKEETELYNKYAKRILKISKEINLKWENKSVLIEFVKRNFPDMRSIISKLQDYSISKKDDRTITQENVSILHYTFNELFEIAIKEPNPFENYKLIMSDYQNKVEDVFNSFGNDFGSWIRDNHPEKEMFLPLIYIVIADYQVKRSQVIQPVIALLAMIFEIQQKITMTK